MFRTITETWSAFRGLHFGPKRAPNPQLTKEQMALVRLGLTAVLLGVATWLMWLNKGDSQTAAAAIYGAICGYWLN